MLRDKITKRVSEIQKDFIRIYFGWCTRTTRPMPPTIAFDSTV